MNIIKSSQLAIMVFFMPLVFKIAMLPSMLCKISGSASYIAIAIICAAEVLQLMLVLCIVNKGGFEGIERKYNKSVARILALPLLFVFGLKLLLFITEMGNYFCNEFFYNTNCLPIYGLIIITIGYIASKGAKCIARIFSLCIWLVPMIVLAGLVFGKANFIYDYLLPFRDKTVSDMFSGIWQYSVYIFDFSPLLFIKLRDYNKKIIYSGAIGGILVTTFWYTLFITSYGYATINVNNAFSALASFNTVVIEIGSLEIYSAFLWLFVSIATVSLYMFGISEIGSLFNIKKFFVLLVTAIALFATLYFMCLSYHKAIAIAESSIKNIIFFIEAGIPLIMAVLISIKKSKQSGAIMPKIHAEEA